jgi:hypothetical protein
MFYEPKFYGLFILCSLYLHFCSYWDFKHLFVNIEFCERQKADFEPSSHFVKILLVVCQNCLNQLDVNKQSLIIGLTVLESLWLTGREKGLCKYLDKWVFNWATAASCLAWYPQLVTICQVAGGPLRLSDVSHWEIDLISANLHILMKILVNCIMQEMKNGPLMDLSWH